MKSVKGKTQNGGEMLRCMSEELPVVGPVTVGATEAGVCWVWLASSDEGRATLARRYGQEPEEGGSPLCELALLQLSEYFSGGRTTFSLPLDPRGTPFQRKVWDALREIPYGQTRSYGQIAARIDLPQSVRAVGAANGANPLCVVVPCHRVIGADGRLVGFGCGLEMKRKLLELEGALPPNLPLA